MEVTTNTQVNERELWGGGAKPFSASYGKIMMWFFVMAQRELEKLFLRYVLRFQH